MINKYGNEINQSWQDQRENGITTDAIAIANGIDIAQVTKFTKPPAKALRGYPMEFRAKVVAYCNEHGIKATMIEYPDLVMRTVQQWVFHARIKAEEPVKKEPKLPASAVFFGILNNWVFNGEV